MHNISGKTALITGASSTIGLAISQSLLGQHCRFIGIARELTRSVKNNLFEPHSEDLTNLNKKMG